MISEIFSQFRRSRHLNARTRLSGKVPQILSVAPQHVEQAAEAVRLYLEDPIRIVEGSEMPLKLVSGWKALRCTLRRATGRDSTC